MKVYLRKERQQAVTGRDPAAVGPPSAFPPTLPPFSQEILDRHQARVLLPSSAVLLAGQAPPMPTAYRSAVLLVPDDLRQGGGLHELNKILAESGVYLDGSSVPDPAVPRSADSERREFGPLPSRPVRIALLKGATPSTVDAWTVLQTLRAAVARGDNRAKPEAISRLSLDHLMVGSAVSGAGTQLFGVNVAYEGSGESGSTPHQAGSGYAGPVPVDVALPAPGYEWPADGGRRPCVVVLDTGVGPHPWFTDGFLTTADDVQTEVVQNSTRSAGPGTR